jgi:hypothetical protein
MEIVTALVDAGVAVVDLEVAFEDRLGEVLGGDRVAVVGVVQVGEDLAADALGLVADGAEVGVDRLDDRPAPRRRQLVAEIRGVDVDRHVLRLVGDLLGGDEDESPALLDERPELVERLEADLAVVPGPAPFDPRRSEALEFIGLELCRVFV